MLSDIRSRLNELRHRHHPFSLLSGHRAAEALDSLRAFELGPGEQVTLRPGRVTDYLYVLEGEVELSPPGGQSVRLSAATGGGPYRLEPHAGPVSIAPLAETLLCRADGELLDYLLSWETLSGGLDGRDGAPSRIAAVRRSLAFRRLPLEGVEEAFRRMRSRAVSAGEVIVRQGEPGDAFYVIERGRAEVWQAGIYDDEPRLVAELGPGDPFGEEALVLRGSRNATVRMSEDGNLLVLDQADFEQIFSQPMIQRVKAPVARACLDSGHIPLDVRYEEELAETRLPGCVHIPLHELRQRVGELDPCAKYVVCCKSGGRSAVGTLLLRQRGFDAVSLEAGLREWPYPTVSE